MYKIYNWIYKICNRIYKIYNWIYKIYGWQGTRNDVNDQSQYNYQTQ